MKSFDNNEAEPTSQATHTNLAREQARKEVVGNSRLTAQASLVVLGLLVVEVITVPALHSLGWVHILVGVWLIGPLTVKLGSTGYRFVRYYTRSAAFVREGPPHLALRVLAPLLVATTVVMIGSGLGLLISAPTQSSPLRPIHIFSFLLWLPLLTLHIFAHWWRVPALVVEEWRKSPAEPVPGRGVRLGLLLSGLVVGAIFATVVLPLAARWLGWLETNESGPGPFIVGLLVSILVLLITRPLRWR